MVGDRGMITSARIAEELKPAGLDWISCLRAPQIAALAEAQGPLQMSLFDERDLAEITSPDFPGERLVACRNPALAAERARKREALLQSTERQLERIAASVSKKPTKYDAAAIGLAVGAVIKKNKMKKHFALDIADGRFAFKRREDEIAAEARLDGIYVVRTSLPAGKVGSEQAVAAYKSLALVERAFRTLKGVDMQVRPIYHWLSERVKAQVFLCMLAYYVEHHMRIALAPLLFADHEPQQRERASIVRPAEPSQAAKRKITRRQGVDGTPIMAWHDLIANLGTLTINEVRLPIVERQTFHMLARPTALQEQICALLGVPAPLGSGRIACHRSSQHPQHRASDHRCCQHRTPSGLAAARS